MKLTKNFIYLLLMGAVMAYVLYQRGIIFAGFENITPAQAYRIYRDDNITLLDVRTKEELKEDGFIEGAVNIPVQRLVHDIALLKDDKNSTVLVYCRSGNRSVTAGRILVKNGYTVYNMKGGISAWKKEKFPVMKERQ